MGYCYLCEAVWLGYTNSNYYCGECKKLQNIIKVFGIKKTLNCVKIKIAQENETEYKKTYNYPPYKII